MDKIKRILLKNKIIKIYIQDKINEYEEQYKTVLLTSNNDDKAHFYEGAIFALKDVQKEISNVS